MQNLSERMAFAKTVNQLNIRDPNALRLAHLLVCETARRQNFIDAFINNTLKPETLSEHTLGVQAFLRLYVYQTRMAKNWIKTDIEEAENIAKLARAILGWQTLSEVEHVLGTLLTEALGSVTQGASDEERIGLQTFHPTWFVKYCFRLFGRPETITMLQANIRPPPTYIRLNTLKAPQEETIQRLEQDGIKTQKAEQLSHTYEITETKKPLTSTASYREGLFCVQDKASCFAAEAADPRPEMTVLDLCAAPGAKTSYLAQLMQNRGAIYSVDYSRRRMTAWKQEVQHLGVKIAEPIITDTSDQLPLSTEADLVVLDPPCTSTGTFAKLPSAKWRLTPRSIERMAGIQWQMLTSSAEGVKPGGTLVYSTCSITVEENEMLIERFLKRHSEFSLANIVPDLGLPGLRGLQKCRRLYTHIHRCNGVFIAKLSRSEF